MVVPIRRNSTIQAGQKEELPKRTLDNRELNDNGTCSSDNVRNRKTEKDKDLYLLRCPL